MWIHDADNPGIHDLDHEWVVVVVGGGKRWWEMVGDGDGGVVSNHDGGSGHTPLWLL